MSSPNAFLHALEGLLTNLSVEATTGSGGTGYASYAYGTTQDSLSRTIYGMVQCWRDISSADCTTCLLYIINFLFTYAIGVEAGMKELTEGSTEWNKKCIVRYEIYSFLNSPSFAEGLVNAT